MLSRLLVLLLLLANVGYLGWRQYRAEPAVPARLYDAGSGVPRLTLLGEREAALAASADEPLDAGSAAGASACFALGPFSNQADLRRAFNALAPGLEDSRQRQTVETRDRGFWVFLPAVESRAEALRVARELSAAGLRDYYVVTAGEQENTVSLGLFRQEENARRRLAALRTLGFDAEMVRRAEESRVYWLDYAARPDVDLPWKRVVASSPGVERRSIPCFPPVSGGAP